MVKAFESVFGKDLRVGDVVSIQGYEYEVDEIFLNQPSNVAGHTRTLLKVSAVDPYTVPVGYASITSGLRSDLYWERLIK